MGERRWLGAAILMAASAVACGPSITDTGYVGTWSRGSDRQRSNVYIDRVGDDYRFRIGMRSDDGARLVTCDEESHCAESIRGEKQLDYQFWTRVEPGTDRLIVEYDVTPVRPDARPYRYVDVVTVEDDGLTLRAATIERDGVKFESEGEQPTRIYRKISDRILEASP